jgi:Putative rhamnosyl transferase
MTQPIRNQIIGLVRFSYPATDGFSRLASAPATHRAELYSDDRMALRFRLFTRLTLPSLIAQTDRDFTLGVLIGSDLPDVHAVRLQTALASCPLAQMIVLPPHRHFAATQAAFALLADGAATHSTGFRLDDDDAIDRSFIARLRQRAAILLALQGADTPVVFGCNRGLQVTLDPAGNRVELVTEKLPIGIGLAMVAPKGSSESIFRRNHRLVPQFYSTFTDAVTPAFIRTVHTGNDSTPHASGTRTAVSGDALDRLLAAHFALSAADLMAL